MAPITNAAHKRRRVEDEGKRPKKKVKKVKKQTDYYSSSDEDAPAGAARDVPTGMKAPKVVEVVEPTGGNDVPVAARRPKPILKKAIVATEEVMEDAGEEGEEVAEENMSDGVDEATKNTPRNLQPTASDSGSEVDELAKNTALNMQVDDSSGDNDDDDGDLADENDEPDLASSDSDPQSDSAHSDADSENPSTTSTTLAGKTRKKRNDPTAFATSISKILSSKLTTTKRTDPVLSRSAAASAAHKALADAKLSARARSQIRSEKRAALEKGRVKDVLGLGSEGVDTGKVLEEEKRLRKMAQRGVVKLFNAVRAAQVKGEEAGRSVRAEGVVGVGKREERVSEMSKQGFLDLISAGGGK
ncbi:hypothetical protein LTR08_004668 [Meristemomyces frigidus]|nr:hypothetical protein LTR08_004668 [Meristemomyces frigidus]